MLSPAAPTLQAADQLARQVLTTRLNVRPGENVTIETYPTALPWAIGFVRQARQMGARPLLHYEDEGAYWDAVKGGTLELLGTPGSHEWAALEKTDVYVYFWGPEDFGRLDSLDESTREKLTAFNSKWYRVAHRVGLRGVRMGIARVTEANARLWGVPIDAWKREVLGASMLDPREFVPDSRKLRRVLERGHSARIRHPNGTDLTLALVGREAIAALGWVTNASKRNPFGSMATVPDGSVYVAVDESSAEGTLVSNRMSGLFGEPVRGGRWTFREGRLVGQSYEHGARAVRTAYDHGGNGRDRPAMLEVGLDPTIKIAPNLEENERGAVSVGVGRSVGFGGRTRSDFIAHLTVGGAELSIDGRTIVRGGRIV